MKTAEKSAGVQGTNAQTNAAANRVENRPNLTGKEAKQDENTNDGKTATEKPAGAAQAENGKGAEKAPGDAPSMGSQSADVQPEKREVEEHLNTAQENAEPQKTNAKADVRYIKPALNLEQTLKSVEGLHRLSIQRLALISRIKLLDDFEVKLIEEGDELTSNHYEGCKLIIEDDKRRQFVTNTPNLIRMVSQFLFNACHEKLAEIEANIIFPNA